MVRRFPKKKQVDTITEKQFKKVKYGTIFKSENGTLRRNIGKNKSHCVTFLKLNRSRYPGLYTVYMYNDLRHKYTIVKY